MRETPEKSLEEVIREDGRYPLEAFAFLHDGLQRAVEDTHGEQAEEAQERHVTGAQLCHALRAEALARWGALASHVLTRWNIRRTIDFGNMVYLLVDNGHMRKTEQDSLEDFRDVYDFEEAFRPAAAFDSETV
ncbi:MAG TPA: Minf_1886 family protein [Phycisphaerae bacterium]|nr:Minf_1886 family protein [Phycisphaerae bacterium]HUU21649.1 Minf_1886 family protein [Phycisphaerae bacterium]